MMQQMVVGLPNKLIAHKLEMSPRTVEIYWGPALCRRPARRASPIWFEWRSAPAWNPMQVSGVR